MTKLLEIVVTSPYSAVEAELGGADRLELCTNLDQGGTSPSAGLIKMVKKAVKIPVFALIRPRKSDFLYSDSEFECILENIHAAKALGIDGIVSGALLADGHIDQDKTKELVAATGSLPFTFHRAFDMCQDPFLALEQLIDCGVNRILTSGQAASIVDGQAVLEQLAEQADGRIGILAGGDVRPHNLLKLSEIKGVSEFHSSAPKRVESKMIFKGHAPMGTESLDKEYHWHEVDREMIRSMKDILSGGVAGHGDGAR